MKLSSAKFTLVTLIVPVAVVLLSASQQAQARGGFGGGSFRGDNEGYNSYEGARGGQVDTGRYGGAAATGPNGAEAVRTPYGGAAAVSTPEGDAAAVRTPYGTTAAVRGPEGNVAVGTRTYALPATAVPVDIEGVTYYQDGNVYYEQYYDGSDVVYVVIPPPS